MKISQTSERKLPIKLLLLVVCIWLYYRDATGCNNYITFSGENVVGRFYRDHILIVHFDTMDTKLLFPNSETITFQDAEATAHVSNGTICFFG